MQFDVSHSSYSESQDYSSDASGESSQDSGGGLINIRRNRNQHVMDALRAND